MLQVLVLHEIFYSILLYSTSLDSNQRCPGFYRTINYFIFWDPIRAPATGSSQPPKSPPPHTHTPARNEDDKFFFLRARV